MTVQTTIDDEVARFRAALTDRETAAREWQRQTEQLSAALQRVRAERDAALAEIEQARQVLNALEGETLVEAAIDIVREEQSSSEAYHAIHARYWKDSVPELERLRTDALSRSRQLAELTQLVGAETPIAAHRLAEQRATQIDNAWREAVTSELEDWGDGGETLNSGQRLRHFLKERADAIYRAALLALR